MYDNKSGRQNNYHQNNQNQNNQNNQQHQQQYNQYNNQYNQNYQHHQNQQHHHQNYQYNQYNQRYRYNQYNRYNRYNHQYNQQNRYNHHRYNGYDGSWNVFRYLASVHMWDAFVYLFLLLCDYCDHEKESFEEEFDDMERNIIMLSQRGGASEEKYSKVIEMFNQYRDNRTQNHHELMTSIYTQLEFCNMDQECLANLDKSFNKMSGVHRRMLLNNFISRVYGYSEFTEYLMTKKDQTKTDQDSLLNLQDDDQVNTKEQDIEERSTEKKIDNEGNTQELDFNQKKDTKLSYVEAEEPKCEINQSKRMEETIDKITSEDKSKINENEKLGNMETNSTTIVIQEKFTKEEIDEKEEKSEYIDEKGKDDQIKKLQQEIKDLRQEAAKYQAELGGIMNVGWRDNDSNNPMQLSKDIDKLERDLLKFTTVKRKGIEIKTDGVNNLFKHFQCKTSAESKNMKLVLGAALQQRLIQFILNHADEYFKRINDVSITTDEKLEAAILSKTNDLIELVKRFTETNSGTDVHTQLLPTKLRQHVYAALGQRSFVKSDKSDHPFISSIVGRILNRMNEYRIIESEEKNKRIVSEAASIVRQVLQIFYFRLYTQEPIPSSIFYESGHIYDPGVMEIKGRIDDDKDFEELEVEICSFPAVILMENSERRVFTKAQVIVRSKKTT